MTMSSFTACQMTVTFSGSGTKTVSGFQNPVTGNVSKTFGSASVTLGSGAGAADEIIGVVRTIAASGTDNLDLSGVLADICNQSAVALSKIKGIVIALLSSTSTAAAYDSTNGNACTSITIGAAASNAWNGPLGTTHTYTINNGAVWAHIDLSAAGVGVTAGTGDILKILNNDGAVAANYFIGIIGAT